MGETIGERLKRLRLERGLSQRELAAPGVSYAYISRIEAGTRQPSVKALRRLADRLGVSAEYLETGVERTTTDDLFEELIRATGQGIESITFQIAPVVRVALTFGYELENRTVEAPSVTEALREAISWVVALERLREERERIDRQERELVASA